MGFENDIVVLRRVYDTFSNLLINDGFIYVEENRAIGVFVNNIDKDY